MAALILHAKTDSRRILSAPICSEKSACRLSGISPPTVHVRTKASDGGGAVRCFGVLTVAGIVVIALSTGNKGICSKGSSPGWEQSSGPDDIAQQQSHSRTDPACAKKGVANKWEKEKEKKKKFVVSCFTRVIPEEDVGTPMRVPRVNYARLSLGAGQTANSPAPGTGKPQLRRRPT